MDNTTVTPGGDGSWQAAGLKGEVTITPVHGQDEYGFEPANATVTIAGARDSIDFIAKHRTPVGGVVVDGDTDPVPHVTIRITYGGTTEEVMTDEDGVWSYADSFGDVTVEAIDPAYTFEDSPRTITGPDDVVFQGEMAACTAGDGSPNDPCIITRVKQLQKIDENLSGHFELGGDIDASATADWPGGFKPIGANTVPFVGTLDGRNHEIQNLHIDRSNRYVGLFSAVGEDGIVRDVRLVEGSVDGGNYTGSVAGVNEGSIEHVYSSVQVYGGMRVGGIVGSNFETGRISEATFAGDVEGEGSGPQNGYIGGIVGQNAGIVEGATNHGTVVGKATYVGGVTGSNTATGEIKHSGNDGDVYGREDGVGGVVANNSGTVENAWNSATVEGAKNFVGGVVGTNFAGASIKKSFNEGGVVGGGQATGGVVGNNGGDVQSSFNVGPVEGDEQVGGVAGRNSDRSAAVSNSYNHGPVEGTMEVGGLVGSNTTGALIRHSYNAGELVKGSRIGGLVGRGSASTEGGGVDKSFWDVDVAGPEQPGRAPDNYGLGKSTAEMQTESTFTDAEWDFANVWQMGTDGYPDLQWNLWH